MRRQLSPPWPLLLTIARMARGENRLPSGGLVLSAHGLDLAFEGRDHSMPGQDSAFDARGELMHAGKYRQLAHVPHYPASHHHIVDQVEHPLDLAIGLALDGVCEQRGGGFGNAAARPREADVLDDIAVYGQVQLQLVAA